MRRLLAGADKVSINSAAVARPELVREAATIRQPVYRRGGRCEADRAGDGWEVYTHGGRTATGIDAVEWARSGRRWARARSC